MNAPRVNGLVIGACIWLAVAMVLLVIMAATS